jgi:hypothetical protein
MLTSTACLTTVTVHSISNTGYLACLTIKEDLQEYSDGTDLRDGIIVHPGDKLTAHWQFNTAINRGNSVKQLDPVK